MHGNIKKKNLILGIAILLLVLVVIFSGLQLLWPAVFQSDSSDNSANSEVSSKTIERNGKKYFPRQDITVFLIMGIDKAGPVEGSGSYNNDGEADVVMLAVLDNTDKTYSIVCLNRDTMLNMPVLGIGGKPAGSAYGQLALSHTYGSGLEDSCKNTVKTVSNFLYGLEIDYYLSMNIDAIGILNDAVGGVKVNVTDDFSAVDPSITKGEITLNGEQAMNFVRTRQGVGDQMNLSRMERHKEYMNGFFGAFSAKLKADSSFALHAYEDIAEYSVTDCSVNTLSTLANRCAEYELKEIVSVEGENVLGKEYMEYHVDEQKLDDLIIRMFYQEKQF